MTLVTRPISRRGPVPGGCAMAHPPGTGPVAGYSGAGRLRVAHARPLRVDVGSVESPVDVDLWRRGPVPGGCAMASTLRAHGPRDAHVRPLRWRTAGHSGAGRLRVAHARPLRHQPAGRPGTGKNAGKGEEGGNQDMTALPTFSNRQDQYTFRSPVTPGKDAYCTYLRIKHHIALFPAKDAAGRVFFFL